MQPSVSIAYSSSVFESISGYFPEEKLWTLRNLGSILQGHPDWRTPGVDVASGSLGQGLSIAVGIVLAGISMLIPALLGYMNTFIIVIPAMIAAPI